MQPAPHQQSQWLFAPGGELLATTSISLTSRRCRGGTERVSVHVDVGERLEPEVALEHQQRGSCPGLLWRGPRAQRPDDRGPIGPLQRGVGGDADGRGQTRSRRSPRRSRAQACRRAPPRGRPRGRSRPATTDRAGCGSGQCRCPPRPRSSRARSRPTAIPAIPRARVAFGDAGPAALAQQHQSNGPSTKRPTSGPCTRASRCQGRTAEGSGQARSFSGALVIQVVLCLLFCAISSGSSPPPQAATKATDSHAPSRWRNPPAARSPRARPRAPRRSASRAQARRRRPIRRKASARRRFADPGEGEQRAGAHQHQQLIGPGLLRVPDQERVEGRERGHDQRRPAVGSSLAVAR